MIELLTYFANSLKTKHLNGYLLYTLLGCVKVMEFYGTLKIRNPKTLQKWIDTGKYQEQINSGWVFNVGCGRFRDIKCECNKCRNSKNSPLKTVLERAGINAP